MASSEPRSRSPVTIVFIVVGLAICAAIGVILYIFSEMRGAFSIG